MLYRLNLSGNGMMRDGIPLKTNSARLCSKSSENEAVIDNMLRLCSVGVSDVCRDAKICVDVREIWNFLLVFGGKIITSRCVET